MTVRDDYLKLKKSVDNLIELFIKTYKIDVLCDKIEKLCQILRCYCLGFKED